ncbi:hypothetical protein K440DRAFT_631056 [Wilcoxina mikolae CBS 423.85]|nr:hypothetical protein K440DRAFT_631056 [Wilcoxina mikolae CBS 423.85]
MPLDENFPTYHFTYADSKSPSPTTTHITFTANGSPSQQLYTLSRASSPANTYTISLLDAHFPSITYATLTTTLTFAPSTDSAPRVVLPKDFTLHLFAPDSSIAFTHHHSALRGSYWEFSLPKHSFPPPSNSALDATYTPPVTDTLRFRWRKEGGVLSRSQLKCSLVSGNDEPDIALAMYAGVGDKAGRGELVVYESNFRRVEMEDLRGLEMVMLLGARIINDVWFLPTAMIFNAPDVGGKQRGRGASAGAATNNPTAAPPQPPLVVPPQQQQQAVNGGTFAQRFQNQQQQQQPQQYQQRGAPPVDRLAEDHRRKQESEKRRKLEAEQRRKLEAEQRRKIEAEQAAIRRMLAEEEAREKSRIDAETERLRRVYEHEQQNMQQRRVSHPQRNQPQQRPNVVGGWFSAPGGLAVPNTSGNGGKRLDNSSRRKSFLGLNFGSSSSGSAPPPQPPPAQKKKGKLVKKSSSMW